MSAVHVVVVVALTLVCMGAAIVAINALFNALSRRAFGHGDQVPASPESWSLVSAEQADELEYQVFGGGVL